MKYPITYVWSCINIIKEDPCKNLEGDVIKLSTTANLKILPRQLEIYQAYLITLVGTRNANGTIPAKTSSAEITLTITELDIPVLEVVVPDYLLAKKINLNENLRFTLKYPDPFSDQLYFNSVFLYEYEPVSVAIIQYYDFRF